MTNSGTLPTRSVLLSAVPSTLPCMEGDEQPDECIRCHEAPAIALGLCGHCHWAVRAEAINGLEQIGRYLERWAKFADWCAAHGDT